jgi:hypothetical protein
VTPLRRAVALVVLLVGGVLGLALMTHRPAGQHGTVSNALAERPEQGADRAPAAEWPRDDDGRSQVFARMQAAEQRTAALEAEVARLKQPAPVPPPIHDAQTSLEQEVATHTHLIDAHRAAPRDRSFADEHESLLRKSYGDLASEIGFHVSGVDCRSRTCVVDLSFPSQATASANARRLVDRRDVPCDTRLTLPPASNSDAPYAAQLYVECRQL